MCIRDSIWSDHPISAAAATVWIQVGVGVFLLVAPRGYWSRTAGAVSAGWGLVVWVFGEGFGGVFGQGSSWLFGSPGAVPVSYTHLLVTGAVTPRNALGFAITLEVVAFAELWGWVNLLSAVLAISATLFYVFVYTLWLKRTSTQNIVIGGAAGAVPVLVGWAAVTDSLAWTPVVLFAIIFVWTPPHFWALAVKYKDDYRAANVPMLPAVATFKRTAMEIFVYSVLLVAVSLLLAGVAKLGVIYIVSASVLGVVFIALALRLWRRATPKAAMQLFSYSITYLTLLFVLMAVDIFSKH